MPFDYYRIILFVAKYKAFQKLQNLTTITTEYHCSEYYGK